MKIRDISLKWKLALPIILSVAAGIAITTVVTGYKTEAIVVNEVKNSTLTGYRDTILNTFTTLMLAGNMKETKGPFLEQMQSIVNLKVVRSEILDKDFGRGDVRDYASDSIEKEVVEKGVERVVLEGNYIRGVYPYIARSNFMGKNCLNCHAVPEGTVLGAVSIKIPLTESFGRIKSMQYLSIVLGCAGILAITGLVLGIIHLTHAPLLRSIKALQTIAAGDLTVEIEEGSPKTEVGSLLIAMNLMIVRMQEVIKSICKSVAVLDSGDKEIASAVKWIGQGIQDQQSLTDGTAEAVSGMMQKMEAVANLIGGIISAAESALQSTVEGEETGEKSIANIREIADVAKDSTSTINFLKEDSQKISDIIKVIKDIADQTNLLALNAAIEAARAGEQGRGFAVVADEVRKLAQKTTDAISEISAKIGGIQQSVSSVVESMDKVFNKVSVGVDLSRESGIALSAISEKINDLKRLASDITTANAEASAVTENVNIHMGKVIDSAQLIGQIATDMGNTAALVQTERHSLSEQIGFFKMLQEVGASSDEASRFKNCWDYKQCGKMECPARVQASGHGFLGGDAAGRACCYVEKTDCDTKECLICPWRISLQKQHGEEMSFPAFRQHMRTKNTEAVDYF
ncbi:MAG: HAMP domain-containing protein [Nitrospirae bacterium]|nr:HAMP domain-containing protein [Nitrospirota bacterium]